MPLSTPAAREPIHHRRIDCRGYLRQDGLWDVEARLTDTKSYAFPNADRGVIEAGTPVHEMWMRLTVDDELVVRGVEARMDAVPYRICPDIEPAFAVLVGRRIGPGWARTVRAELGGTKGCRHLVELLGPMATVAFQTIAPLRPERFLGDSPTDRGSGSSGSKLKPAHIDTCHAMASNGEIVRRDYPDFYTGFKSSGPKSADPKSADPKSADPKSADPNSAGQKRK
ncbi:MAG: DUF2889 domain-containing protein [Alphaproteobacteria bacterium]